MTAGKARPWPLDIRLNPAKNALTIAYDSGEHFQLSAEYLRVESPSAEVQGHGTAQKNTVIGKQDVTIRALDPVGNYALRITFDDGHDTGLFSWDYLHELGREYPTRWAAYQKASQRD